LEKGKIGFARFARFADLPGFAAKVDLDEKVERLMQKSI
jgi:hypothetical protein